MFAAAGKAVVRVGTFLEGGESGRSAAAVSGVRCLLPGEGGFLMPGVQRTMAGAEGCDSSCEGSATVLETGEAGVEVADTGAAVEQDRLGWDVRDDVGESRWVKGVEAAVAMIGVWFWGREL